MSEQKNTCSKSIYIRGNHNPDAAKRKERKGNKREVLSSEFSELLKMFRQRLLVALRLICPVILSVTILLTQYSNSAFAGAISVPREARSTAETAKMIAQENIEAEQAVLDRLNAVEYVKDSLMLLEDIEKRVEEAEKIAGQKHEEATKLRVKAQIAAKAYEEAAAKADLDRTAAEKAMAESNEADYYAKNFEVAASKRIESVSKAAEEKLDALGKQENDISELQLREIAGKALEEIGKIQEETSSDIETAYERAQHLYKIADMLEAEAEKSEIIAEEKLNEVDLAEEMAVEAEAEALSAQEIYDDLFKELQDIKAYVQSTKTEMEDLVRAQNQSQGVHYGSVSVNYYSWKDSHGNSGRQITKPFSYGYWQKEYSYGITANHINSSTDGSLGENGSANAFYDTELFFEKRTQKDKYLFNYGLNVSLPTGKDTLSWSERNAMMSEDLVEVNQLGKGWQITPKISVDKKINKEDTLTLGTDYSFNGSYNPSDHIPDNNISPGGEWRKNLRWQHAGKEWQVVGEVIHTTSSPTKVSNGNNYDIDPSWEQRLTVNRKLSDTQDMMFYYWRQSSVPSEILPSDAKEAAVNYLGTMWSRQIDDNRAFKLTFDVMRSNGNHYSGMINNFDNLGHPQYTSVSVDGRTKYTLGAIYDFRINETSKFIAELQKFTMKDGPTTTGKSSADYHGINLFLSYNKNF